MIESFNQAREEMFKMLADYWALNAGAVVGEAPPVILWQGEEKEEPPPQGIAFARATVLHRSGRQASLAGTGGARMWGRGGVLIVQCFGPLSSGMGLTIAEGLAKVAVDAFQGKASPNSIWFRNCRLNEIGPADGWFQVNMIADFIYSEEN